MSDKVSHTITKGLAGYHEDFSFTGVDDPLLVATISVDFDRKNKIIDVRLEKKESSDQVKKPKHYQLIEGIESIEIIARSMTKEQWKGYCLGNMLKYRIRAGKKDALQQDIEKADFYGELYEMHKEKCYD